MKMTELAKKLRPIIEHSSAALPDEIALQGVQLFPVWTSGLSVKKDERYQYNGVLYRVVQEHTTQDEWTPDKTPAMWTVVSLEEWPEFVQPTGVHDAYNKGDKVTFNGEHYICVIDSCTWSPQDYPDGWELQ